MNYGRTIIDGELQYTSPSSLGRARQCLRDWGFHYVLKRRKPPSKGQLTGTEGHGQIERYYKTGEPVFGTHVLKGRHFIPDPHKNIFAEQEIKNLGLDVEGLLTVGKIDVLNMTGEYINPMGEVMSHRGIIPEVLDWKFLGNLKYAKSGQDLLDTIQMNAYGLAVARPMKHVGDVRLSHVYFCTTRKRAEKNTILTSRDRMETFWGETVVPLSRLIRSAASEPDPNKLPANTKACGNFGGCFHKPVCTAWQEVMLESVYGVTRTKQLEERMSNPVQDMMAKLEQQEASAGVPQNGASKTIPGVPAGFAKAIEAIELAGFGRPQLGGEAAKAYAYLNNLRYTFGAGFAGTGTLNESKQSLTTVEDVVSLASQITAHATAQASQAKDVAVALPVAGAGASPLPPDAPPSNPAIAADPVDNPPPGIDQSHLKVVTKPGDREKELKKMKKGDLVLLALELEAREGVSVPMSPAITVVPTALRIFVNVQVPEDTLDLQDYIDTCVEVILSAEVDLDDIRCAEGDSPLAFGKWKGVLSALVKRNPPSDGTYTFRHEMHDDIGAVVIAALRGEVAGYGVR